MKVPNWDKEGGPAFPVPDKTGIPWGMSLRDWFAGQALIGICSTADAFWDGAAPLAYQYADAMLKTRKGPIAEVN